MSQNTSKTVVSGGISFSGALFIALLVLKLTHVIDCSWWWVFAPFWIPLVIVILVALVGGTLLFFAD